MKTNCTPEEKQVLIDRYLSNKEPVGKLLASAGVPRSTFYGWLRAYQEADRSPQFPSAGEQSCKIGGNN